MRLLQAPVTAAFMAGIAGVLIAMPALSRAQELVKSPTQVNSQVSIRAARRDTVKVEAGTAVTAVFAIRNAGDDSVSLTPRIVVPRGWRQVSAVTTLTLAGHAGDTWLAGISVPAGAEAGTYIVRGELAVGVADSAVLRVVPRREIEVVNLDTPGWVMSGAGYEARFIVRNAGNVRAAVKLTPSAGRSVATIEPSTLDLAPGASAVVKVRTTMAIESHRTIDDVIQVVAADRDAPEVQARASALTTIVPRTPGGSDYSSMPALIALRTGGGASGVAPLLIAGSGMLVDSRTSVDFFLQAPTDQNAPWGFGERDEYRVNVTGRGYAARLGDNVYGGSIFSATGVMGSGAEYRATRGNIEGGAFVQRLRWTPNTPTEEGFFATIGKDTARRVTTSLLFRQTSGHLGVAIGTLGGVRRLPFGATAEGELALSDSAHKGGAAWRGRVSGEARGVRYEFSTLRGNDAFAGTARGTIATYAVASKRLSDDLDLSAAMTSRNWSNVVSSIGRMGQSFSTASVTATWRGMSSLEFGRLSRRDEGSFNEVNGAQNGVRLTSGRQIGIIGVTGSVERGVMHETLNGPSSSYALVSLSVRTPIGSIGNVGLSGSRSAGRTLTGANGDVQSAGANAQIRLPGGLEFGFVMSAQRATFGMLDTSGAWFSVTDARLEKRLENGMNIGIHARTLQSPSAFGSTNSRAIYLEVRTPFRLPTGRSRETGRAMGRVMDAEKNAPVPGVLVRVGDQASVSDDEGRVRFAGLDSKVHHVAVDPSAAAVGAILIGDVLLDMTKETQLPSQFAVGVTRGARVVALVQRSEGSITGEPQGAPTGGPAGLGPEMTPLNGVLVALEGPVDTLYQVTDARGVADFGTVVPGNWTASVRRSGDEAWMEFERGRVDVKVTAGERRDVEFRLVPVQRSVKMMDGGGTVLRSKAPQPKPKQQEP